MTQEQIERQIEVIRRVSAEVRKSPESARQFLIDAGIIREKKRTKSSKRK